MIFIVPFSWEFHQDELHHVSEGLGLNHQPDNVSTPKAHGKDIFVPPTMSMSFVGDLPTRSCRLAMVLDGKSAVHRANVSL